MRASLEDAPDAERTKAERGYRDAEARRQLLAPLLLIAAAPLVVEREDLSVLGGELRRARAEAFECDGRCVGFLVPGGGDGEPLFGRGAAQQIGAAPLRLAHFGHEQPRHAVREA